MSGGPSWFSAAGSAARSAYAGVYDRVFPPPSVEDVYAEQAARIKARFPAPSSARPLHRTKEVRVNARLIHPIETVTVIIHVPIHEQYPRVLGCFVFEMDVQRETRLELLKRHKFPAFESRVGASTVTGFAPFTHNEKIKCTSEYLTLEFVESEPATAGGKRSKRSKRTKRTKRTKRSKRLL